jgi:TfoX/Sxy family transcriptional regulator of competence genes
VEKTRPRLNEGPGLCHNTPGARAEGESSMPGKWKKSPPSLIAVFDRVLPADAEVSRRSMFGYPVGFVHGLMFTGLFEESLFVRLPEPERTKMIAEGGGPLAPMPGRVMKDYAVVPADLLDDEKALSSTVRKSLDFTKTLPAKSGSRPKTAPARRKKEAASK